MNHFNIITFSLISKNTLYLLKLPFVVYVINNSNHDFIMCRLFNIKNNLRELSLLNLK